MTKSTWMVIVVTIAVLSLEIDGAATDTSNKTSTGQADPADNKTNSASLTNTSTSVNGPTNKTNTAGNEGHGNNGNTQPLDPTQKNNSTGSHVPPPPAANDTNARPDSKLQGVADATIPPNDKGTTKNTTSVQISGVNIPTGNVLMLSAYLLLCLEIYFR